MSVTVARPLAVDQRPSARLQSLSSQETSAAAPARERSSNMPPLPQLPPRGSLPPLDLVRRGPVKLDDIVRALSTQKGVMPASVEVRSDAQPPQIDVTFKTAADMQKAQSAFPSTRWGTLRLEDHVLNLRHQELPPGAIRD